MPEPSALELGHSEATTILGEPDVEFDELAHASRNTATLGVWRVRGRNTRAVLKLISTDPASVGLPDAARETHPSFVAREPRLYRQGLPPSYTDAGIALPRLLAAVDRHDAVALWLEDADGTTGGQLTVTDYAEVARRLGRAQGVEIARPSASHNAFPWSHDFLTAYLASWDDVGWPRIDDDAAWSAPLIAEHFSPELRVALVQLCRDRRVILGWATALPHTICHQDVWPHNVFASATRTTLIDWAFAGFGNLGSDPGNLVTDTVGDLLKPAAMLPELDAATTAGYREGLRDAGWTGDFRFARLGMCLMAAKWAWLVPHMLALASADAHAVYGAQAVDSDELFAARAAMLAYYVTLAAEARTLAHDLGIA